MTLSERFDLYDKTNPQVYDAFKKYAHELRAAGNNRGGACMIFEHIRWQVKVRAIPEGHIPEVALNNSYRAFYARKLAIEDPSFADFFEFREQKSKAEAVA